MKYLLTYLCIYHTKVAIIKKNLINNLNDANLTWRASLVF